VRYPIALSAEEASLTLCFLRQPVDFEAPDGQPVFALFFLVTPTTRAHLQMLAKIAYLLRDPAFREAIRGRAPSARLVETARRLEGAIA
jgi:PTS system nitrogen regulatory IIA component